MRRSCFLFWAFKRFNASGWERTLTFLIRGEAWKVVEWRIIRFDGLADPDQHVLLQQERRHAVELVALPTFRRKTWLRNHLKRALLFVSSLKSRALLQNVYDANRKVSAVFTNVHAYCNERKCVIKLILVYHCSSQHRKVADTIISMVGTW